MKTNIKPKQLFLNHFRVRALRFRWAGLALWLGLLNLALADDPDITRQPTNQTVSLGGNTMFRVLATTTNYPISFQWQHSATNPPAAFTNLPGATINTLRLTNVVAEQAGDYQVIASSGIGNSVTSQVVTLTIDPTFIKITEGAIVTDREASVRASWCDYDGDGFQDLFVANQYLNGSASKNSLYHNNGDGTFTKITTNALSATASWSQTGAWADVDNDGDPDLYVGGSGSGRQSVFYRNDGNGRFTAVSIVPTRDAAGRDSWLVQWGDYDQDGWVDLFIPTPDLPSHRLFRNLGDLNFKSMTAAEVGDLVAATAHSSSSMATWVDYDNDGDLDIYVMQAQFALYLNSGNGFFTRTLEGSIANVLDANGDAKLPSWADYDNDGYLDAFVSWPGFAGTLHHNLGGTNSVAATDSGLEIPADNTAAIWGDYDNDGNLDLFLVNNPLWAVHSVRGANLLFRGNGDGTFTEVDVGSPIWEGSDDWDASWIDYDNDGFLDLFIAAGTHVPEVNYLYRNNLRATGNTNHWLKVNLVGRASNASGIGAKVRVTANIRGKTVTQLRPIESPGYVGSNQGLLAHFGLGDATKADTLRIEWPSGIVQEWKDVAVDQHLTKVESQNPPPLPPQFTASGHAADGTFQATVACAAANLLCVFEASTNLVQWTKLSVRTNTTGTVQFDDPGATNRPARFYRVVVP